jgi:hypothetical protein
MVQLLNHLTCAQNQDQAEQHCKLALVHVEQVCCQRGSTKPNTRRWQQINVSGNFHTF